MLGLTSNATTAPQLLERFAKSRLFGSERAIVQCKLISNHVVQARVLEILFWEGTNLKGTGLWSHSPLCSSSLSKWRLSYFKKVNSKRQMWNVENLCFYIYSLCPSSLSYLLSLPEAEWVLCCPVSYPALDRYLTNILHINTCFLKECIGIHPSRERG